MPGDGAECSKEPQNIVQSKSPRAWTFGAKSFKSAGNKKTLRNGHNSGKKRDNFELRTKIIPRQPRPKHSRVAESLPRPATCHSPMTDISVIRPLRWSFWWRIYPSCGTQRVNLRFSLPQDLAARNIMVDASLTCKVTTQRLETQKYFLKPTHGDSGIRGTFSCPANTTHLDGE